jgi:hypothetical protein
MRKNNADLTVTLRWAEDQIEQVPEHNRTALESAILAKIANISSTERPAIEEDKLEQHCREFIKEQRIRNANSVYQCDRVIENACTFIEGVCEILGYYRDDGLV